MNVTVAPSYTPPAAASSDLQSTGRAVPADNKDKLASSGSTSNANSNKTSDSTLVKLKARDQEVRQHEQAHISAAGGLATSAPSYTYQRGSDGQNYAIGGEVSIDVSPGRTPEETLRKAQTIEKAALAPKDPSGPDRNIAVQARKMAQEAQAQLREQAKSATQDDASGQGKDASSKATQSPLAPDGSANSKPSGNSTVGERLNAAYAKPADATRALSAYA